MCDVFSFSNILIIFTIYLSLYQKFSENINFANTIIQLLDARRVHFVPNWKVGSHHSIMGSMIPRLVNESNNQNKIITPPYKYVKMCKSLF